MVVESVMDSNLAPWFDQFRDLQAWINGGSSDKKLYRLGKEKLRE